MKKLIWNGKEQWFWSRRSLRRALRHAIRSGCCLVAQGSLVPGQVPELVSGKRDRKRHDKTMPVFGLDGMIWQAMPEKPKITFSDWAKMPIAERNQKRHLWRRSSVKN